jgi:chorismate synthase
MASSWGKTIKLSLFGQSHSAAIGVVIDGLPAGIAVDTDELRAFMKRRAPGQSDLSTPRKEADEIEILSGVVNPGEAGTGAEVLRTCGAPICIVIKNTDTRSQDYAELRDIPRPGHADYTAYVKYGEFHDIAGGGHFSGRLTAPLCAAGGICVQLLRKKGIEIKAKALSPTTTEILSAKADDDSIGGVIECVATGVIPGLGEPIFGGVENKISSIVFGIPAVKGIEFGAGFAGAGLRGSDNNDEFFVKDGQIFTRTNNCGGILGGITNGMPIVFRVAIKPTPSIGKEQKSISLSRMEEAALQIRGRHDPCIVPRAAVCVEAACAIALTDLLYEAGAAFNE